MSRDQLVDQFEATNTIKKKPSFNVGDTVKVSTKIIEGEKERIQAFTGVVIARKGIGNSETFTVYRNAYGSSMERVFLINSPRVADVEVSAIMILVLSSKALIMATTLSPGDTTSFAVSGVNPSCSAIGKTIDL